jgi:hypothetical protein
VVALVAVARKPEENANDAIRAGDVEENGQHCQFESKYESIGTKFIIKLQVGYKF